MSRGIETENFGLPGRHSLDVEFHRCSAMLGERVQHAGDLTWDSSAHQHVIHASEHCTAQRRQIWQLYLGEKIDADQSVVAFPGQIHFDEIREHRDLLARDADVLLVHRKHLVRLSCCATIRKEVALERILTDVGDRKMLDRSPYVSTRIAVLESAHENRIERSSRNDAKMTGARNGARQRPV